ncbi:response regulator [Sulfitobacter faviae]|uniref:response regulator n=1 Tax=Sulfitobacter faviae TaxID=1775881 RepID=UPI002453B1F3
MILNLAINARDAMAHHGKLTIEVGNAALDDAYTQNHPNVAPGQYVMLAITDTGAGIPPEIMEKVFDPFFTTKETGEGTGLGLSMVYGFVKQSGGHIKLYSEEKQGTTVRVYLPRTQRKEESAPLPATTDTPTGSGEVILVVEDDAAVRETAVDQLRDLGYGVLTAENADSALAIVKSGVQINLLFTDVVMPGKIRSPELAREAKAHLPNVGVLFTSGYTQNAIVHAGRLDEGVDLLSKPYTRERLALKIHEILSRQTSADTAQPAAEAAPSTDDAPKVLLVEDDALICMATADMLADLGYVVTEADSVAAAERSLQAERFDVMFTDLGLPDGSGMELVQHVTQLRPEIAVIIASGADPREYAEGDAEAGRYVSLMKPYDEHSLKRALEQCKAAAE